MDTEVIKSCSNCKFKNTDAESIEDLPDLCFFCLDHKDYPLWESDNNSIPIQMDLDF